MVALPTSLLLDKKLSFTAIGIAANLAAYPEDAEITRQLVLSHGKESPAKINAALKELKDTGYITII